MPITSQQYEQTSLAINKIFKKECPELLFHAQKIPYSKNCIDQLRLTDDSSSEEISIAFSSFLNKHLIITPEDVAGSFQTALYQELKDIDRLIQEKPDSFWQEDEKHLEKSLYEQILLRNQQDLPQKINDDFDFLRPLFRIYAAQRIVNYLQIEETINDPQVSNADKENGFIHYSSSLSLGPKL